MQKNRRANAVVFGFDFQVNAAIVLMLENMQDFKSLRLEGNYEDIEIELNNGEFILAQAKAVVKSCEDFKNVRANLNKALCSLSDGANESKNATQLILITNSPNPLNEAESKNLFLGTAHRSYNSLPKSSKDLIDNYLSKIKNPLDTNKFLIQILPFETDNELERYKIVKNDVNNFVVELNLSNYGISSKNLMGMWQNDVFMNSSKEDTEIKLNKSDIIWPIMVQATNVDRIDDKFADNFDACLYQEIVNKYRDIIDSSCERCEFFIKVLSDYQMFESSKKSSEKCLDFAFSKWMDYKSEFTLETADSEIQKGLIQIIIYSIVRNNRVIDNIKRGVNL